MPLNSEQQAAVNKFTATDHKGKPLQQAALLRPNPMVARILVARAATLSDDERLALKSVLTPQTAPALKKLLPELVKGMDRGVTSAG